jgi:hypothetical protein
MSQLVHVVDVKMYTCKDVDVKEAYYPGVYLGHPVLGGTYPPRLGDSQVRQ